MEQKCLQWPKGDGFAIKYLESRVVVGTSQEKTIEINIFYSQMGDFVRIRIKLEGKHNSI